MTYYALLTVVDLNCNEWSIDFDTILNDARHIVSLVGISSLCVAATLFFSVSLIRLHKVISTDMNPKSNRKRLIIGRVVRRSNNVEVKAILRNGIVPLVTTVSDTLRGYLSSFVQTTSIA
jgi:hypothetical protein